MRHSWMTGVLTGAVVGVAAFAFTETIQAQGGRYASGTRIGCIDVLTVFNEFQRRKDLNEEVNELNQQLESEEMQRRNKIDALQVEVDSLQPDDPTRRDRLAELYKMQTQYKAWGETVQSHLSREVGLWTIKMYQEILAATKAVAEREGYDMILYRGQFEQISIELEVITQQMRDNKLLYAHPSTDLTQTILDRLNEDYRSQPRQQMLYVPVN